MPQLDEEDFRPKRSAPRIVECNFCGKTIERNGNSRCGYYSCEECKRKKNLERIKGYNQRKKLST